MVQVKGESMIKIKVSYETEKELAYVMRILKAYTRHYSVDGRKEGRFRKAYFTLK